MDYGFAGCILIVAFALIAVVWSVSKELRIWFLLSRHGASTAGICARKTEEPDGDGYIRTLYVDFEAVGTDGQPRKFDGKFWVPLRIFRRINVDSDVRIRYCIKDPRLHRMDEDDYRDWGFRSAAEAAGDVYPDTRKSGWDL